MPPKSWSALGDSYVNAKYAMPELNVLNSFSIPLSIQIGLHLHLDTYYGPSNTGTFIEYIRNTHVL